MSGHNTRRWRGVGLALAVAVAAVTAMGVFAQEQSAIYLFAVAPDGVPILEIDPEDVQISEDVGESIVVSVTRFGWPLKVVVLLDNGTFTRDWLVHYRSGLKKFFAALPREIPVSLVTTAPAPRFIFRESTDPVQIERGVDQIVPDDQLGRFSDSLIEYSRRLDEEFRRVSPEQLPPYLPVLVSIATTTQDGSDVRREDNADMINSLRRHRVWTNFLMIRPSRENEELGVPTVRVDEGQNAEIARYVEQYTGGRYFALTGSGSSALTNTLLPELSVAITRRYIRQMTQHRIIFERPPGASGPMKGFSLKLMNHPPGTQIIVSTNGSMP